MTEFLWEGPDDSDEEVESMAKLKTEWEVKNDVKFSKRGLIEYIEKFVAHESKQS